jgi:hypothetical protein
VTCLSPGRCALVMQCSWWAAGQATATAATGLLTDGWERLRVSAAAALLHLPAPLPGLDTHESVSISPLLHLRLWFQPPCDPCEVCWASLVQQSECSLAVCSWRGRPDAMDVNSRDSQCRHWCLCNNAQFDML